jgi:hypothetical protein
MIIKLWLNVKMVQKPINKGVVRGEWFVVNNKGVVRGR